MPSTVSASPAKKYETSDPKVIPKRSATVFTGLNILSLKFKWTMLGGSSILLAMVFALILTTSDKIDLSLPFFKSDDITKPKTYVSIGPLISSVDSGDLIRMTLDINCTKMLYRKQIIDLDTEIRDRVIWAFQTPEAVRFIAAGDYFALRTYLSRNVMEIVPKGIVKEIYISELLRF